jgi:exodeoxyribonuclease VII large subunit
MDSENIPVLRVGQAITICNTLLSELEFAIEGEVASFSLSRGKFVFFDLKDEQEEARLACFMMAYQMPFPLEVGMRIVVRGRAGLYQKSGQFRISVTNVEARGEGSLKRAYELLRLKLQEEGLFATDRKRLLPRFAEKVGIISSVDGAGFGDFQTIAFQRLPGVKFILANVAVQGKDAETEIVQAFDYLNSSYALDVIVLIRGGGSIEDLHAFNSEPVARAIVRSKAPVVVGVGHERDITIADFCADVRAATPSNAAQLLLPTKEEVEGLVSRLTQEGQRRVERAVQGQRDRVAFTLTRLKQQLQYSVQSKRQRVESLLRTIEVLSPQATLLRGYSITSTADGKSLTPERAKSGVSITTRLADAVIQSIIT